MGKKFFEVFPTVSTNEQMTKLLQEVEVTKVSANPARTHIHVYILSKHLIHKQNLVRLENTIKEQLFEKQNVQITITETYELSGQYNPEKLLQIYRDSMEWELEAMSVMVVRLFKMSEILFPEENVMMLRMPDNILTESKSEVLITYLRMVFQERCNLKIDIRTEFYVPEKSASRLNQELTAAALGDEYSEKLEVVEAVEESKPAEEEDDNKPKRRMKLRRSNDPDVIYGRDIEEDNYMPIHQIYGEMYDVLIRGKVVALEEREIKNERTIVTFTITDFTDSIRGKLFVHNDDLDELRLNLKANVFVKIKANTKDDTYDHELELSSIVGIKKIPDFVVSREDRSAKKRVELHCHTKMSDMDGVSDVSDILKRAKSFGHTALAITDHGVVQAFPDANHFAEDNPDFKVIYGCEGYLVDDLRTIASNTKGQSLDDTYVVFDLETTGFSPLVNKIIEIGAVKVENGQIVDRYSVFVNPEVPIPFHIEDLTGISDNMVLDAPTIEEILPEFLSFCEGAVMVAHNANFDMSFIRENANRLGLSCDFTVVDTVEMARAMLPHLKKFKLDVVAKDLGVSLENHHRAVDDAGCTAEIFTILLSRMKEKGITDTDHMNDVIDLTDDAIKRLFPYHVILLATNDIGRVNLYRLVSESHIRFMNKSPRIPKSLIMKYREGILVGSACEAGELFQGILRGLSDADIAKIVDFYDYLEVQPIGNNKFMIESTKHEDIENEEDLRDLNRRVIQLGEDFNKPVVATCDVHFLEPEDEVYRRIIMAGKGFTDADDQAPLYLRTTEEMLNEFEYLGSEKAYEIVVENTNMIADMCEFIEPVRPDKCPPVIPRSDETLREICYNKAHEMYGDPLPEVVSERLERELNSIISNGFAVMYIIAQKLVWKSNEDGYLVGSRGSVGSSFVATMSGITEVNPLSPHYYCKKCHYSDFDSEEVKAYGGNSGCDMPDKACPVCGEPLLKDGFDIPFETFLGFLGNKEPDIDLNFSGEYQSKAHKYTEVIFGDGQTFRAGTIGTLADKTAFGFVKKYYEEHNEPKRNCEIDRIVKGCVGVRRTTGQHPGGIVVLPYGEDINTFTPVQHPPKDEATITTHFDYHKIEQNLLKLDILGHDDPTMIRMLEDLIGFDAKKIPLDDPGVMSLFRSTEALGISPEDIDGCPVGSLGIPEFGTDFVIQMLLDTKPSCFSDLIRIAGLGHGTDVWLGNAQTLIKEGKATISTAICTRDDIMIYLIHMGLEPAMAFDIMEAVRKGKVAGGKVKKWPQWKEEMTAHGVPDWYIWSCEKIQYMFPKAHAAAYVMMAWRIAYCKINHPLAYYAAYFSIRATSFNYGLMCRGKDELNKNIKDFKRRKENNTITKAEEDTLKDMRIVQEMYARGFEFLPIDLYRAKAHRFQIIDDKLMPAFDTIDGMGDMAADSLELAVRDGKFLSKEDLRNRGKISKTVVETMAELGLLEGLPETNQLSLFDFV